MLEGTREVVHKYERHIFQQVSTHKQSIVRMKVWEQQASQVFQKDIQKVRTTKGKRFEAKRAPKLHRCWG